MNAPRQSISSKSYKALSRGYAFSFYYFYVLFVIAQGLRFLFQRPAFHVPAWLA
jgi:hypothetical protein